MKHLFVLIFVSAIASADPSLIWTGSPSNDAGTATGTGLDIGVQCLGTPDACGTQVIVSLPFEVTSPGAFLLSVSASEQDEAYNCDPGFCYDQIGRASCRERGEMSA